MSPPSGIDTKTSLPPVPKTPFKTEEASGDEDFQKLKKVLPLLEPTDEGWTSGLDSIISPKRSEIVHDREPPSASGRLGYQGLPNSTSAPTIAPRRDRSASPTRTALAATPETEAVTDFSHASSRQHPKVSFEMPRAFAGSPSNRAKYENPPSGLSSPERVRNVGIRHLNVASSQATSIGSRATGASYSSSDKTRSSGASSDVSKIERGRGGRPSDLDAIRLSPTSSPDVLAEPTKNANFRVNSKAEQILGSDAYRPESTTKHETRLSETSWYKSPVTTRDSAPHDELNTPESTLQFPVGLTMEDLNDLLDDSIKGQRDNVRCSSLYERSSLPDTNSHRRSRSVSPDKSYVTPEHSPSRSSPQKVADDHAKALLSKPLPRTPEQQPSKPPSKVMIGDHGWLQRDPSFVRKESQKMKQQSGLRNFANKIKQRAEEKVRRSPEMSRSKLTSLQRTEISNKIGSPPSRSRSASNTRESNFPISVGFSEQMRILGELELMLTTTANTFLMREKDAGRLAIGTLRKINEYWRNQNRPQVIEFRYDLHTQYLVVEANKHAFRFAGPPASEQGFAVNVMLNSWRSVARTLGLRTFCLPDSDMRKLFIDSYRILELLGAQFEFSMLLNRLQKRAMDRMAEAGRERAAGKNVEFGVTRQVMNGMDLDEGEGDGSNHGIYCG